MDSGKSENLESQEWSLKHHSARHQKVMLKFWKRMGDMYFSRWGNNFGHEPTKDWSESLETIPEKTIGIAITSCFARPSMWPPILGEFLEMCNNSRHTSDRDKVGRVNDCPERRAWVDTQKSKFNPGGPGYTEFFEQRVAFHFQDMGKSG